MPGAVRRAPAGTRAGGIQVTITRELTRRSQRPRGGAIRCRRAFPRLQAGDLRQPPRVTDRFDNRMPPCYPCNGDCQPGMGSHHPLVPFTTAERRGNNRTCRFCSIPQGGARLLGAAADLAGLPRGQARAGPGVFGAHRTRWRVFLLPAWFKRPEARGSQGEGDSLGRPRDGLEVGVRAIRA